MISLQSKNTSGHCYFYSGKAPHVPGQHVRETQVSRLGSESLALIFVSCSDSQHGGLRCLHGGPERSRSHRFK